MQEYKYGNIKALTVTFNSAHIIETCYKSCLDAGIDLVVVDNASTDDTVDICKKLGIDVVALKENVGFGRGNNEGVEHINAEYILFMNPDIVLNKDVIGQLLNAAERYQDFGMIAPNIDLGYGGIFLRPNSFLSPKYLNQCKDLKVIGDCCLPFLSGACFLMKKQVFEEIGGFDPNIFLYYEDNDICRRLWDLKMPLIHINEAHVLHQHGKSTKHTKETNYFAQYHFNYSKVYVAKKFGEDSGLEKKLGKYKFKLLLAYISLNKKNQIKYRANIDGIVDALKHFN